MFDCLRGSRGQHGDVGPTHGIADPGNAKALLLDFKRTVRKIVRLSSSPFASWLFRHSRSGKARLHALGLGGHAPAIMGLPVVSPELATAVTHGLLRQRGCSVGQIHSALGARSPWVAIKKLSLRGRPGWRFRRTPRDPVIPEAIRLVEPDAIVRVEGPPARVPAAIACPHMWFLSRAGSALCRLAPAVGRPHVWRLCFALSGLSLDLHMSRPLARV